MVIRSISDTASPTFEAMSVSSSDIPSPSTGIPILITISAVAKLFENTRIRANVTAKILNFNASSFEKYSLTGYISTYPGI